MSEETKLSFSPTGDYDLKGARKIRRFTTIRPQKWWRRLLARLLHRKWNPRITILEEGTYEISYTSKDEGVK